MLLILFLGGLVGSPLQAGEASVQQRLSELERRLQWIDADMRWQDPVLWHRVKKALSAAEVERLLGQPARIEEQIFPHLVLAPDRQNPQLRLVRRGQGAGVGAA